MSCQLSTKLHPCQCLKADLTVGLVRTMAGGRSGTEGHRGQEGAEGAALAVVGVDLEAAPESQVRLCLHSQSCSDMEASWVTWGRGNPSSGGSRGAPRMIYEIEKSISAVARATIVPVCGRMHAFAPCSMLP